ncbi:MAG: glycosyltransferase family 4 protein [Planctomycetes bacterium]|nr:glycosyltransferase family 4 protein [Planctomycetota bacterium]
MSGNRCLMLVVPSSTSFLAFFRELAEAWIATGGEVTVAAGPDLPGTTADWPAGVDRVVLPAFRGGSPTGLVRTAAALRRAVAARNPAIVHAHFSLAVVLAAAVRGVVERGQRAWLGTFHGMHLGQAASGGSRWLGAAEVWAARRMTAACVLNPEDALALGRHLPGARIRTVPGFGVGCDLSVCSPSRFPAAYRADTRRRLGIPDPAFVVAYVGRRTAFKGFAVATRGFLGAALPDARLMLVGSPDAAHRSGLTLAERARLEADPRIVDLGWQRDVPALLVAADVCLLPSTREGVPVSAMESLAVGTPVITVDSRGCRDVVRHGVDGIVLPLASERLVSGCLIELAADRHRLAALAAAAVMGRDRFDRGLFVAGEIEWYESFVGALRKNDGEMVA